MIPLSDSQLLRGLYNFTTLANAGLAIISSTAYESGRVLKGSAGSLVSLSGYNSGAAGFIQLHDSATVPPEAVAEVFTIDLTGKTPAGLANKYITFNDGTNRYAWFNLDTAGVDPALVGRTGTPVAITTGDSSATMATALAAALDALAGIVSTATGSLVTATNASTGARADSAGGNSGATVLTTVQGISVAIPIAILAIAATSNFTFPIQYGLPFLNGISVNKSSTGPTKTVGGAECFFTGVVK